MATRTREERLFGAACLRVKLELSGANPGGNEIYQATLGDLGLVDDEVSAYLSTHRAEVESALQGRRQAGN